MGDFAAFNKLYEEFFAPYKPARSCVEVAALPKGVAVEMECVVLVLAPCLRVGSSLWRSRETAQVWGSLDMIKDSEARD